MTQTQTAKPTQADPGLSPRGQSGLVPYRMTVRQFEKMIITGVLGEEDRVELLAGLLINKMTINDPDDFAVDQLGDTLSRILPADRTARQEKSVVLGRYWRPQPDIAVARGPRTRYRSKAPRPRDLGLLVEAAESSYVKDRGPKWVKYAGCGVLVYWIVDISDRRVEVYTSPSGRGKSAVYRDVATYGHDEEVPVIVEGRELGRIKVSDLI